MKKKSITLLGGYGQVGSYISELIIKNTDYNIIIADIRIMQKNPIIDNLVKNYPKRVKLAYVNTNDLPGLIKIFNPSKFVIVTTSTDAFNENIVKACLQCGCDYIDTLESETIVKAITKFEGDIKKSKRLFITQAGLTPGLPSMFTRHIKEISNDIKYINIAQVLSLKTTNRNEQVYNLFDFVVNNKPLLYRDKNWQTGSYDKDKIMIDYGDRFGKINSLPIYMNELKDLTNIYNIEELMVYGAVPSNVLYYTLRHLLLFLNSIKPKTGWKTLSKYILSFSKKNKKEPSGYSLIIEGFKNKENKYYDIRMILDHEDNYYSTAAIIMSLIHQYSMDQFKNYHGVKMMGHIVNNKMMINDLKKYGLHIETLTF